MADQIGQSRGRRRFERAPWKRPRGAHEVVEYLYRHHFDEVVIKLGRHPWTRNTSEEYRENLAAEVLRRMLEARQLERYELGAVGAWIDQAIYRHRNETDRHHVKLTVTEGELTSYADRPETDAQPLDRFPGSRSLEPEAALEEKRRSLASLELQAQLTEELQQLYQLRWEQGLKPREIRSFMGWSTKQYELRDARLKAVIVEAIERSSPDSIVRGRGDGSACRELRDLLPLMLRKPKRLAIDDRRRLQAHLLACDGCRLAAREAQRVIEPVRPLFVPAEGIIGGSGGGVISQLVAKIAGGLGLSGGSGVAALKMVSVAGCIGTACFAGTEILRQPPAPTKRPVSSSPSVSKPIKDESPRQAVVRRPAPRATTSSTGRSSASRASTSTRRKRPSSIPTTTSSSTAATMLVDPNTRASEFSPEAPPVAVANAPARQPAAPVNPDPAGAAGGAEFAGP